MRFEPTAIPEVIRVEPQVFRDARGFFLESYHEAKFAAAGVPARFVQDNHSRSTRGTLRGLHMQLRFAQGKLVRCIAGEVFDVAVDARRGSKTFGRWVGETLSAENFRQLWVPPGFLHGFCVVSETAEIQYKCTELYHPEDEIGVIWNDPELAIRWPLAAPLLSAKDSALPRLGEVEARLPVFPQ
ncbi:MAG TPA: dTDP-4-dehydrorhamnose 3,5-epimerase [Myxococcota bacterium]|nr:dTDP-4-dehydrorhamnose 3,5-epimerase [Myxococcota bacterium]